MEGRIVIDVEFAEHEVFKDLVDMIEVIAPYMTDNVVVRSTVDSRLRLADEV